METKNIRLFLVETVKLGVEFSALLKTKARAR